jgi:hypothetical protein
MRRFSCFVYAVVISTLTSTTSFAGNFGGYWKDRNMDGSVFIYTDDGYNVRGTLSSREYEHTFSGNHQSPDSAYINITRVNRNSGCITVMYARITMVNPYTINQQIMGSDGRCDVPVNYTEFRILDRQ